MLFKTPDGKPLFPGIPVPIGLRTTVVWTPPSSSHPTVWTIAPWARKRGEVREVRGMGAATFLSPQAGLGATRMSPFHFRRG